MHLPIKFGKSKKKKNNSRAHMELTMVFPLSLNAETNEELLCL